MLFRLISAFCWRRCSSFVCKFQDLLFKREPTIWTKLSGFADFLRHSGQRVRAIDDPFLIILIYKHIVSEKT